MSDRDIEYAMKEGDLSISSYDPARLQPSSYDMTLSASFAVTKMGSGQLRLGRAVEEHWFDKVITNVMTLQPGQFVLASTAEQVGLSTAVAARVEGKSSLARMGLMVHITAGFIDPGFEGQVTLELFNASPWRLSLFAGMPIAQLSVFRLDTPARVGYTGKYQGQRNATPSKYHENFVSEEA